MSERWLHIFYKSEGEKNILSDLRISKWAPFTNQSAPWPSSKKTNIPFSLLHYTALVTFSLLFFFLFDHFLEGFIRGRKSSMFYTLFIMRFLAFFFCFVHFTMELNIGMCVDSSHCTTSKIAIVLIGHRHSVSNDVSQNLQQ